MKKLMTVTQPTRHWRLAAIRVSLFLLGSILAIGQTARAETTSSEPIRDKSLARRVMNAYRELPLRFEPNEGQTDPRVDFISRGDGYTLFLTPTEAVLRLRSGAPPTSILDRMRDRRLRPSAESSQLVRMRLVGGNRHPAVAGVDKQEGVSNYIIGNDPSAWLTDIHAYGKVRYRDVYPDVDLIYYGNQRRLEYDFIVNPGADPSMIRLAFDARELRIDEDGSLVIVLGDGEVRQQPPLLYQQIGGKRRQVPGSYRLLDSHMVGFEIGTYDPRHPLVIDPVLLVSTYLGGTGDDEGYGMAIQVSGTSRYAVIVGGTTSTNFPTQVPYQGTADATMSAFVTKFNPTGSGFVFSTYLGGNGWDRAASVGLDSSNQPHVVGETCSTNFPRLNALQSVYGGNCDMFVTKLNATGSALVYSTYVGGSAFDGASMLAMAANYVVVGGVTDSANFPTLNPSQPTLAGGLDGVVLRIRDTGTLNYSTYFGGSGDDAVFGVAVDSTFRTVATGYTTSTNLPLQNPIQSTHGGEWDAFVVRYSVFFVHEYSTYLGGSGFDFGTSLATDQSNNIYVAGATDSTDFLTQAPLQAANAGGFDAFVTKMSNTNLALIYSTYLGGSGDEEAWGVTVPGSSDNAYVAGFSSSTDFPGTTANTYHGANDAFISRLNSGGSGLVWSEYLGGTDFDVATRIVGDISNGLIYLVGITTSTDYPTLYPVQANNAGGMDTFVAAITSDAAGDLNSIMLEINP
jgi:hypothetical protein